MLFQHHLPSPPDLLGHVCQLNSAVSCRPLLLPLLSGHAGSAQGPIGPPAACGSGKTYRVFCFIDSWGYLADVQFSNTIRTTPVSLCGTPQGWQLQHMQQQVLELSAADSFVYFRACGDSGGLRELVFHTALGAELGCGSPGSGGCRFFSSRSTYPLRGFQATCVDTTPKHRHEGMSLTRVSSITGACWSPQRQAPSTSKSLSTVLQQHPLQTLDMTAL